MQERLRRPNQHDQAVPDHILRPLVEKYYLFGYGDKKILKSISREVDLRAHSWTLSTKTIQRRRKEWRLPSVKQQAHTFETIAPYVEQVRLYTNNRLGSKSIRDHLRQERILVSRKLVQDYNQAVDADGNRQRLVKRLKPQFNWSTGLHECWSMDQHDKWRRFGLFLHVGLEEFSNYVLWLKVWWTNSNPRLIASFYLDAAGLQGGIPLITQSDPGTENYGIANAQTTLRRQLDPTLEGTLQHRWMRGHANIKPEIFWSKLRRQWSEGWELLFQEGIIAGWYDPLVPLELLLFRWLAVPMIQQDLDRFRRIHNTSKPRRDKKKRMPAEIPAMLFEHPGYYGPFLNYKVIAKPQLREAAELFAPKEHHVFRLVPAAFSQHVTTLYNSLGKPLVERGSFWDIYNMLLKGFAELPAGEALPLQQAAAQNAIDEAKVQHEFMDILEGKPVRGAAKAIPFGGEPAEDYDEEPDIEEDDVESCGYSEGGDVADLPVYEVTATA
ncbi:hypothetical protein CALCODRAFT_441053 [Calocera cornea HHB12733]|uniref:Integrase core domain-containing protein n=1 Tax=Calocera cornea HHB12733 TaxID=1353952 RepID=A0A165DHI4_9BASI|nr:hypothetical protein CALCODRAFT_441053 [Calocera cornea HHB12733]